MLPFGRTPQPFKESYELSNRKIKIVKDVLIVECDRCTRNTEETKRYKIHQDGAISFHFHCTNCMWSYSIYRNQMADYKQTERAILK